jgi:hypothetical protein
MLNKQNLDIKVNILHDNIFKFTTILSTKTTIKDLKNLIVQKLGLYSVNYLIQYNERDYSNLEIFTLGEIFITIEKDKEYTINLKDIETYVRERKNQRVVITYQDGGDTFYVYNLVNMKFESIIPEKSKGIKFDKFPYNSRYLHVKKENRILITGGIDYETGCCSYDYDLNILSEHPNGKNPRQMHSMVNIKEDIFVIGGLYSKDVDCFSLEFEDWTEYPKMNYDRKDPSVCIVNEKYIYVFMGYSQNYSGIAQNFERLDIQAEPFTKFWELLPINNPLELPMLRLLSAVLPYENGFLFLGGLLNYKCDRNVYFFELDEYIIKRSKFILPFEASFVEKDMFSIDNEYFYLYAANSTRMIRFDKTKSFIGEVVL